MLKRIALVGVIAAIAVVAVGIDPVLAAGGIVQTKAKDLGQDALSDGYFIVRIGFAAALLGMCALGAWKKWDMKWIVSLFFAALVVGAGPEILDRAVPKSFNWNL